MYIYDIGYMNIGSTTAVNVSKVFAVHKYQVPFLRESDALGDNCRCFLNKYSWGWNFKELLRNKLRFTWDWAEVLSKAYIVQMLKWV